MFLCKNAKTMDWDDLKYVLAVYREGGLSGAAKLLGVNHSTVSRRITQLEDKIGARLFERFASGLKPTIAGVKAAETARMMEAEVLDLDLAIAGRDRELSGALKVSIPQLIFTAALVDIFKAFQQQYPKITLNIVATTDAINLHRREADVSIQANNTPEETLWGRKVLTQNCGLYASKDYLLNRNDKQSLDCLHFPWRGDKPSENVLSVYPEAKVVAFFDDMVAAHGAVVAGMGVARMPCFLGDTTNGLVRVPGLELQPYSDVWVLTHPDLQHVPRIRAFMDFAIQELAKKQDLFHGKTV